VTLSRLLLPALLGASLLLRAVPWAANLPLHHDEALYGTWARAIADGSDPLLLIPWVDKPPLVLYLLALSLRLFGPSELALRAPGMLAGVLATWATYGLAQRLYGRRAAGLAAALLALSPFAILFGPTAFTDPWLMFFIIAASWAAVADRPLLAGVLLGFALASKQQGVFGVPLVLALLVAKDAWRSHDQVRPRQVLRHVGLAILGFAPVFAAVTYWDSLRWHNRPSYWDQSLRTYGGVMLAPLSEWPQRAVEWARQLGYLFGAPAVTALMLLVAVIALWPRLIGDPAAERGPLQRSEMLLGGYVLCYLIVHLAFTFQPWDRYLLPVLPLICILSGRGLLRLWSAAWRGLQRPAARWAAAPLILVLVYAAWLGVTARVPVGSDIGGYHGVAEAAQFLAKQPAGTTVYFDRLGWHFGYYLYGLPIARSWYDGPTKLGREVARVANQAPNAPQWLALPDWESDSLPALKKALASHGFITRRRMVDLTDSDTAGVALFRIEPFQVTASAKAVPTERMR
jgi:4-amino-4-deoxy-L-arabinose transferase-like glycosyltransferase